MKHFDPSRVRLFIASPCYGPIHPAFVSSVVNAQRAFVTSRLAHSFSFEPHPDITWIRNSLASKFLRSDATDLLFCDVDQQWDAYDVVRWLHTDLPMVGAPIHKKQFAPGLACSLIEPREHRQGYVKAFHIGTGLLLIRRHVLEAVAQQAVEYHSADGSKHWDLFGPVMARDGESGVQHRLGEDTSFLCRARIAGFDPWLDPRAKVTHYAGLVGFDVSDEQRAALA